MTCFTSYCLVTLNHLWNAYVYVCVYVCTYVCIYIKLFCRGDLFQSAKESQKIYVNTAMPLIQIAPCLVINMLRQSNDYPDGNPDF